jgi:SulP family sulfate permease
MSSFQFSFRPRLVEDLKNYNHTLFFRDIAAGLTVGVVALPLSMAFAIASGVKPEAGIFTAIIAGFLISALGGSRVQIGGPAGAFIVIIYGILEKYGLSNLLISTTFAGMLLFLMGVFKLGSLVRFIPVAIVIGFTNGIAVLIVISQIKDFFGLKILKMPGDFFAQITLLGSTFHSFDLTTIVLALASLLLIFLWPTVVKVSISDFLHEQINKNLRSQLWKNSTSKIFSFLSAIPSPVVVLVFGTIAVTLLHLPVETIGSKFGGIPQALPVFKLPIFSWDLVKQLFAPTMTIALLGAIESLMSARVADNLTGDRHDPNQELMAQGIANFVTPFFGGLPATGTIARTVTNIRSGAASPIAGMVHSITILITVLIAAPLAQNIPLASLAAILMFVAFNMGEWREFARLKKFSNNYRVIMLGTFFLTVIIDLTVAVEVGLLLACIFFVYRISSLTTVEPISPAILATPLPQGVVAYSIFGSLFFGAVDKLEQLIDPKKTMAKVMILELHHLISIDTTGLDALEILLKLIHKQGGHLVLCGLNQQPLSLMQRSGFYARLGVENCVESLPLAIARAGQIVL